MKDAFREELEYLISDLSRIYPHGSRSFFAYAVTFPISLVLVLMAAFGLVLHVTGYYRLLERCRSSA